MPFTIVGPTGFVDGEGDATGIFLGGRSEYTMATITRAEVARETVATLSNPDAMGKGLFSQNNASTEPGAWLEKIASIEPETRPE